MRPGTSSTISLLLLALLTASLASGDGAAAAQAAPDGENGRYTMTPIPEGVLRLDTRTGVVSTCSRNGSGWACYAVPDERAALDAEIGRLQVEVEKLKTQLAATPPPSPKIEDAMPKSDSLGKAAPKAAESDRKLEIPLPSDEDVDRVMSFLERAWRRLIEMANRVQKDVSGRI